MEPLLHHKGAQTDRSRITRPAFQQGFCVLIKIAFHLERHQGAEQLELEGIHCNLTLLFSFHQAWACVSQVTLISPLWAHPDWTKNDNRT